MKSEKSCTKINENNDKSFYIKMLIVFLYFSGSTKKYTFYYEREFNSVNIGNIYSPFLFMFSYSE